MNTKVKSNGMSGCVNTWPFELPVQQMQNRLELGCKIVQCDSNFKFSTHNFFLISVTF
jgi:hypothetical protein